MILSKILSDILLVFIICKKYDIISSRFVYALRSDYVIPNSILFVPYLPIPASSSPA